MAVTELTIKLLDGVAYNNPNIGELKNGHPSGVSLKKGETTNIPYEQIKNIQSDLERGRVVIVGIIDDDIGVVGVPSKKQSDESVTGPAAAKKELEHELKHGIKSDPESLIKIKEDRFDPTSKDKMIEPKEGETHAEAQERIRTEISEKNKKDIKDEVGASAKKVSADMRNEAKQAAEEKSSEPTQEPGRNANQELKQELDGVTPGQSPEPETAVAAGQGKSGDDLGW